MSDSLQVLSVTCNHCGAPLEIPPGTRYVTCRYCSCHLQIHQNDGVAYTEVLEALDARTQHLAADLESLKRQNDLDKLDREWSLVREKYGGRATHENPRLPGSGVAVTVIGFGLAIVFLSFWISTGDPADSMSGVICPLLGVAFLFLMIAAVVVGRKNFSVFLAQKERYEQRRKQLVDALNKHS